MKKPLSVLIVEDSEDDVLLAVNELERGGYEVSYEQVDSAQAMEAALNTGKWDLVLSDYSMPVFCGPAALSLLKEKGIDIPFIILSGTVGEDVAVAVMKDGAHDYIMKGRLTRLVPAVERELREAEERRGRRQAEDDLRRSEEQLRQSQKLEAIGRLAGGIAHDFNNYLTIIMGHSDLILERLSTQDKSLKNATAIKEAAHKAGALTHQLLAFSRKQILEPRVFDLNEVVTEISKLLRRLIGEDVELALSLQSGLGKVKADPGQIEQVIMNLVVNARDAMPDGGRLTIETSNVELDEAYGKRHASVTPGAYVNITVTDTGTGMDRETQARIFEPFFTTKEMGKGTGLGLATVYGIVKQSGGHIWVYSEIGCGTTFKIYLPRVKAAAQAASREKLHASAFKGSETVLLAEDDEMVRELACQFLSEAGYTVMEAGTGEDALKVSLDYQASIDLLITDAVMPKMSGRELAQRMCTQRPDVRVLYISGYTDDAVLRNGLLEAGTSFLQKPFTRDVFLLKVREILEGRRKATG